MQQKEETEIMTTYVFFTVRDKQLTNINVNRIQKPTIAHPRDHPNKVRWSYLLKFRFKVQYVKEESVILNLFNSKLKGSKIVLKEKHKLHHCSFRKKQDITCTHTVIIIKHLRRSRGANKYWLVLIIDKNNTMNNISRVFEPRVSRK